MQNRQKIQWVSHVVRGFCGFLILLIPLLLAWLWANPGDWLSGAARQQGIPVAAGSLTTGVLILGFLCSLLPAAAVIYGLYRLWQLFSLYTRGEFFSHHNIAALLGFARALFVSALLTPLATALLSVILTWHNPPGQRALVVHLGSGQVGVLLVAGIMLVIAWIMREALALAEDNAGII